MEKSSPEGVILVTGVTGFVAAHVVYILLQNDCKVRGTVRSLKDENKYMHLKQLLPEKAHLLDFCQADLLDVNSWDAATQGVQYIMHVASPFPAKDPKNPEKELYLPARQGTENVLKAALKNGVKKVVITSSIASVMFGHADKICTEEDWSVETACSPYEKSKLYAERSVWEFWKANKDKIEIVVLNPGFILGPPLSKNGFTSGEIIEKAMKNKLPGIPRLSFPVVDVRDVALAHYRALLSPESNGKRYILTTGCLWVEEILTPLRDEFSNKGYKIVSKKIGKCPMTLASWFDPSVKMILPHVGLCYRIDNSRSKKELGLEYRPVKETVVDMAYKLIEIGIVPKKK